MGSQKTIGIFATIVAITFFIPWLSIPFGGEISPFKIFSEAAKNPKSMGDAPIGVWLFLASFILAAVVAALAFTKGCGKGLAIIAGLLPLGLIAFSIIRVTNDASRAGLPLPSMNDFGDVVDVLSEVLSFGVYGYVIGAVLLTIGAVSKTPAQADGNA
ncbi:hypothetical protein N4R57_21925 [Rhodobacteraceae bacterium D3-12]|nr:hypothetical protein N4R57_21925 [Rhodobacteraceae bacterium D3-12]